MSGRFPSRFGSFSPPDTLGDGHGDSLINGDVGPSPHMHVQSGHPPVFLYGGTLCPFCSSPPSSRHQHLHTGQS
jgi:hypothetical protein